MALKGSLKEFGLAEIFQLIGHQQKTGVLSLTTDTDEVRISFENGIIVGSEHPTREGRGYLGEMLVKAGFISRSQLNRALNIQKETLQRLGDILIDSEIITKDDLIDVLNLQMRETLHGLFRWKAGSYNFEVKKIKSKDESSDIIGPDPINPEHILMEGLQMVDEWPEIQRAIHSLDMVFALSRPLEDLPAEYKKEVTADHKFILELVNGKRPVKSIVDLSRLGEFEASRLLKELLDFGLIAEITPPAEKAAPRVVDHKSELLYFVNQGLVFTVFLLSVFLIVLFFKINPLDFFRLDAEARKSLQYAYLAQREIQAKEIRNALEIYHLEKGQYPENMETLVAEKLLATERTGLLKNFDYKRLAEGYQLDVKN